MNVRCVRCGSQFEFEDALVSEAGVAVRCSSCGHLFRLRRRPAGADERSAAPTPSVREWRVRAPDGSVQVFTELLQLKQGLDARQLSADHEVSLTGEKWVRIGQLRELMGDLETSALPTEPLTPVLPPGAVPSPREPAEVEPAAGAGGQSPPAPRPVQNAARAEPKRRGVGAFIAVLCLVALGVLALGAYALWTQSFP